MATGAARWGLVRLWPTYLHLFVLGWLTQMIFGVAHWMFPRASRDRPRGHPLLGWTAFGTLNAGLLLRVAFEPLAHPSPALLLAAAALQALGAVAFVAHIWPRVRAV